VSAAKLRLLQAQQLEQQQMQNQLVKQQQPIDGSLPAESYLVIQPVLGAANGQIADELLTGSTTALAALLTGSATAAAERGSYPYRAVWLHQHQLTARTVEVYVKI
jgi:hypothetical protein